ncbi:hypothetical protein JCM11641_001579 [Rhodosporidiobolus odoratus]
MTYHDPYHPSAQTLGGPPNALGSRPLPARRTAGDAAFARSLDGLSLASTEAGFKPSWERRPWDRLLNDELLPRASKSQVLATLEILVKNVVQVAGAYDLLIQSGFRKIVTDFEEKLTFPLLPSPTDNKHLLARLSTGKAVISEALERAAAADELERTKKEASEAEKTRRMTGVLEEIKTDREMVSARASRERTARRRAREAKEIQGTAVRDGAEWDRA